jgi:hypothetical protein
MVNPDSDGFSLERLEFSAYARRHEAAAAEVMKLLAHLNNAHGGLGELGNMPSSHLPAEQRDAHYASRIASAITALFSDPNFRLSDLGYQKLIPLHRWLAMIFGASALGNADHVIHLFNQEEGAGRRQQLTLKQRDFVRFSLVYGPDSRIPLQPEVLWRRDKRLAAALFVALLSSRIVMTEQAHAKKELLLGWLPPRLKELSLDEFPIDILHDVWMHCSYAMAPNKHAIKRAINELVRARLLALGYRDRASAPPARDKPVLLCVLEWFYSNHSMYRVYASALEALRRKYRVVAVSLRGATDDVSRRVFDEVHTLPRELNVMESVRRVAALAEQVQPDIVHYPSVGMFLDTVFLVNLRLAPIQTATLGHPATTHSPFIDYVMVDEDCIGDPACFSERLVALPNDAVPHRPPADSPRIAPEIRSAPDPVRIAVTATSMKMNPVFLHTLRRIVERSKAPVEFWFFSSAAFGLTKVYLQNLIRRYLPDWAVVYPHFAYARYIEHLNRCDMFVNPFPFGNTNGIVDTTRQGLPGVCLTGAEVHSHIDEGFFRRVGLPEWLIARSTDEYVAAAARLAENAGEREALSRRLLKTDPGRVLFSGRPELFGDTVAWLHDNHARLAAAPPGLIRPPLGGRTPDPRKSRRSERKLKQGTLPLEPRRSRA